MMSSNGENESTFRKIETLDLIKSAERRVRGRNGGGTRGGSRIRKRGIIRRESRIRSKNRVRGGLLDWI